MATAVPSRHRRPHAPLGVLSALEALALAALSFYLVLVVIPDAYAVEWSCFGQSAQHTSGDTYVSGFVVLGALGWLATLGATALANATNRPRLALLIPVVWFALLTGLAAISAAMIGPLPC
jgi:hypothetical protein